MGLPALNGRAAWRWRPNPRVLPSAVWPLILVWRVLLLVAGAVWRAPERILPGLRQRRQLARCGRDIDRAIAAVRRHQIGVASRVEISAEDAPFEAGEAAPVAMTQPPRPGAIILAFPHSARAPAAVKTPAGEPAARTRAIRR